MGGPGGIDPNLLSSVLSGKTKEKKSTFIYQCCFSTFLGMNPNELIPFLSSMRGGGGGAGGALPNLRRTAGGSPSASQRAAAGSNSSSQRTGDSRPNTAPAASRTANTSSSSTATAPIQMSTLTNVLANLGTQNATSNSIDLCEIMKSEVSRFAFDNRDFQ